MKTKTILGVLLLIFFTRVMNAQKQQFDVVDFALPKNWKQNIKGGVCQINNEDSKTGEYVLALITKSSPTSLTANQNFDEMWKNLVAGILSVEGAPTKQKPETDKGWNIISGQSHYTENGKKGLVTLINATGSQKTTSVLVMTNTAKFQDQMLEFINSLGLNENGANQISGSVSDSRIFLPKKAFETITY